MSQQPETRFKCDRCGAEASVAHNDQPALDRGKPPADWLALLLGGPTVPAQHLCGSCAMMFRHFMREVEKTP